MIEQVAHTEPGTDPAQVALALAVAHALHAPTARAPEVAPAPTGTTHRHRTARRRTVRG
ncbi:hypothetical protein [Streptomyces olindensis]|uniref:hypothetical protein n=1 Tax=Streptomyces olindensis TaxID=358823 RepID=UPI0033DF29ED